MGNQSLGRRGERVAAWYLRLHGYRILAANYRTRFGELDLVARQGDEVVFVEVKTRTGRTFGYPEEAVHRTKLRHIVAAAEVYRTQERLTGRPFRIDVISVEPAGRFGLPKITHLRNVTGSA